MPLKVIVCPSLAVESVPAFTIGATLLTLVLRVCTDAALSESVTV
jgi:hypothetical protein